MTLTPGGCARARKEPADPGDEAHPVHRLKTARAAREAGRPVTRRALPAMGTRARRGAHAKPGGTARAPGPLRRDARAELYGVTPVSVSHSSGPTSAIPAYGAYYDV
ncbi:hypothetical protein E1287_11775 [Actinomadura sp. KC06]|uniref:hypothetical protein n=1 Tax=Actinomadura sp. KC06 TaxID=2530369 RepID=UPI00104F919C|nr:hypothetical protein [Actinomadura sp. KC06]TDD36191.1 hypothetical protein E1287_11775 [Actinomadura sp. KC06]